MDKPTDSQIIDRLGGTTEVARICQIKPPSVSEWRSTGIPPARRQFLALLCPEAFADVVAERSSAIAHIRQLVDSRMSKRALRDRFGFKTDAHLAVVLQLPAEQVASWPEEGALPALPQIQKLLGHEPQAQGAAADQDPDETRIIPVEAA